MKTTLLLILIVLVVSSMPAVAQGSGTYAGVSQCWNGKEFVPVKGNCPTANNAGGSSGASGGSTSAVNSAAYGALNQAGYQLGYAFGQWLFGGGKNPQVELQKRLMMQELARRQAEAAALHREEEARRLAAMYNRLNATLKLSGLPDLQLKDVGNGPGLHLKLGDNPDGQAGIKGLPGIYLNDRKVPYGIPGLPGMYVGGPGEGSGLTNSKLALKTGDSAGVSQTTSPSPGPNPASTSATPDFASNSGNSNEPKLALKLGDSGAAPPTPMPTSAQAATFDPSKMTPRQLADAAEMFSKLPPEEQQRLLAGTQNAAGGQAPNAVGPASEKALQPLQEQNVASQAAVAAPVLEDASAKAGVGFDTPLGPGAAQPPMAPISGYLTSVELPATAAAENLRTAPLAPMPPLQKIGEPTTQNGGPPPVPAALGKINIIEHIDALAGKLGWSAEKQARLDLALNKLDSDGDPDVTGPEIRRTWQNVIAHGQDPDLAREAAQGRGLGFPGAGTQTVHQDCAVFALANAAGLPYGVVATRATELIRLGDWRDPSERANPQATIEHRGLTGGEVIMLAESFGQAQVVSRSDFAKTLDEGRPVLINVVPLGANPHSGHEVVLTRAFQHGGETWFEMMDSNQGPQRRLFLSSTELNTILQENGVAFRPEPGLTPKLLRDGGDQ